MCYLSATFLLRLRHALGNSLKRIGARSLIATPIRSLTRIHWLYSKITLALSIIILRLRSDTSRHPCCSAFDKCLFLCYFSVTFLLRLRHALGNSLKRIGALSYNSYADKVTGKYPLVSLQDYVNQIIGRLPAILAEMLSI